MNDIWDRERKLLVGKTVVRLLVSSEEHSLLLDMSDGTTLMLDTDGDSCSESWFSDIYGIPALIGHKITGFEPIELPDYNLEDGRCRQNYDELHGFKITTKGGYCDIVFRNSSSGYYGGWMEVRQEFECDHNDYRNISGLNDWMA